MISDRSDLAGPVGWLAAQAVLFGAVAALLGVVANAIFLAAFGAGWLPATYIVIGVTGIAVSAAIRRLAQRLDLLRLAVAVLGGAAGLFALAWLVAGSDGGAWVSAPLLVLFPILIQLGFVFIGGQAGRVLDIGGMKSTFPRVMAGFPVGAALGGLVAVPLVDLTGRVEDLLLVTAVVQAAFAAAVLATGRRFAGRFAPPAPPSGAPVDIEAGGGDGSLRRLLGRPLIALLLGYQVLSALGSQIADFLVFDRASAMFPDPEDLGRFVAGYTAVMNAVAIAFLFLAAGPLLRRFGLRLGIAANPFVDLALASAVLAVLVVAGPASFTLLAVVSAARIADIGLTDGLTRTSINALYQVVPLRQRLAAQATVEGMGVPIAIGASGLLILLIDALPEALAARVVVLGLVCALWAWVALRLYRAYAPALSGAIRHRRLLDLETPLDASPEDVVALGSLATGSDPRSARLARELAALLPPASAVPVLATRTAAAAPPVPADRDDSRVRDLGTALAASRSDPWNETAEVAAARMLRALPARTPARDAVLSDQIDHPVRPLGLLAMERLAGPEPGPTTIAAAATTVLQLDLDHADRIASARAAIAGTPDLDADGVVRRSLHDELNLVRRRVQAALLLRHGRDRLGSALAQLARTTSQVALAVEALEVAVGRETAARVIDVLAPEPAPLRDGGTQRSRASVGRGSGEGWLRAIVADEDRQWRSSWLRACAQRALEARDEQASARQASD